MESTNGFGRKPPGGYVLVLLTGLGLSIGCAADRPLGLSESNEWNAAPGAVPDRAPRKATGTVEIVWPGGRGRDVPPGEEKLAFAKFEAFPATATKPARGAFVYRVLNADSTPHREIVAVVSETVVDPERGKAWFVGQVVSDTKICSGGSCDGHDGGGSHDDGGCSGGTHDDGGCSDGTHDDGGCSDGTHDDGGCSDGTHDDGGCSDATHDDGGCSDAGTDGGCSDGTHDDGGCASGGSDSGSGTTHGGGGLPGKDPRVGQIVVVKVHDVGTPGTNGDGITWKWFAPGTIVDLEVEPKCLCKKEIIGGNIVVHPVTGR